MNLKKITALVVTLAGVILISGNQKVHAMGIAGEAGISAVLFGLLAGFCYSLYYIFGKHFSDKYSASVLFFIHPSLWCGLSPALVFVCTKEHHCLAGPWGHSFFSTFAAYHFYYAGLRRIEAGRASIIATAEPVVAALVAWCWWGESFTVYGYMGSLLILAAVLLMIRS